MKKNSKSEKVGVLKKINLACNKVFYWVTENKWRTYFVLTYLLTPINYVYAATDDGEDLWINIWTVVLDWTKKVGFGIAVIGGFMLLYSWMRDDPDTRSKSITVVAIGVGFYGLSKAVVGWL